MNSLIINAGSSSVKFQLFHDEECQIQGMCDEIGSGKSKLKITYGGKKEDISLDLPTHKSALDVVLATLDEHGFSLSGLDAVGHRVVHGGEEFKGPVIITAEVIAKLKELIPLAPLHNPVNILGIELMMDLLPKTKQVAIFDTAFHSTLPEQAYLYGVPYKHYKKHHIRKYGFHGSSHRFVVARALELIDNKDAKVISCHLGNGASICATKAGVSLDTTMGFTPMQGSIMGTRCGLIDPSIVPYLMKVEHLSIEGVEHILNKESGFLGLSELSSDHRIIEEGLASGHEGAKRAHDVFCYRLIKFIGAYIAVLGGVDAIVFTGGIGEKSSKVREDVLKHFSYVGLELNLDANNKNASLLSTKTSKVKAYLIPTNEELQMVREIKNVW